MDEEGQKGKVACVVRETLKAQASNFVLDPRFNWEPVELVSVQFQLKMAS